MSIFRTLGGDSFIIDENSSKKLALDPTSDCIESGFESNPLATDQTIMYKSIDGSCSDVPISELEEIAHFCWRDEIIFSTSSLALNYPLWCINPSEFEEISSIQLSTEGMLDKLYVEELGDSVGRGLFAKSKLEEGEVIGHYGGVLVANYHLDDYTVTYPSTNDISLTSKEYGNIVRFINHAPSYNGKEKEGEEKKDEENNHQEFSLDIQLQTSRSPNSNNSSSSFSNVKFIPMILDNSIVIHIICKTGRVIEEGEQLLVDYGKNYWKNHSSSCQEFI